MRKVFADTGYWVALINPADDLHARAREVSEALGPVVFVTSEMVLAEFLNDFAKRGELLRAAAKAVVDSIRDSRAVRVIPQTPEQFTRALALYGERKDKTWGLTDCASCLIMQDFDIGAALTYDRHFEQMGFQALLRTE